jgi:hypothetical protein
MIGVLGAHFVQNIHNKSSYETFHFIFSKNVKIGIRCSIVIPDSPQETPLEIMEFFLCIIVLGNTLLTSYLAELKIDIILV